MKIKKILKKVKNSIKIPLIVKQQMKINTLRLELETLENVTKNELYKEFVKYINQPEEITKLKKQVKSLKKQNKELKEIIKGSEKNETN